MSVLIQHILFKNECMTVYLTIPSIGEQYVVFSYQDCKCYSEYPCFCVLEHMFLRADLEE